MRAVVVASATAVAVGMLTGCSSSTPASDLVVGDCVQMSGPPDRPEAVEAECGSSKSNFTVVAVFSGSADTAGECPSDVDSYYSMRGSFSDSRTTVCLDIDWVVGDCMSIDPAGGADPARVDCTDAEAPGRQRVTEILTDVANADQCASGVGYPYEERDFTVCVEDVR